MYMSLLTIKIHQQGIETISFDSSSMKNREISFLVYLLVKEELVQINDKLWRIYELDRTKPVFWEIPRHI